MQLGERREPSPGFPCGRPANRSHWSLPKTIASPPLNSAGKIRALAESLLATARIHASEESKTWKEGREKEKEREREREGEGGACSLSSDDEPLHAPLPLSKYATTQLWLLILAFSSATGSLETKFFELVPLWLGEIFGRGVCNFEMEDGMESRTWKVF